jgi:diacylglycerol kinase family enzyme
VFGDKRNL